MAMAPDNLPRADLVGLDARVVAFVLLTTLLSGTLLVIAPAARLSRQRPTGVLQSESRSATGTGLQRRVRSTLVVTEVAMALALLVAAGGLMAAFVELQRSELGIDPRGVETFEVNLPATSYAKGERRVGFSRRLLDSIEQMPGIDAAGAVTVLPVTGRSFLWGFFGKDHPQGERPLLVDVRIVDGDFFGALGMELAAGRTFEASDFGADTPPVLIANRHLVERYLGESFRLGDEARLAGVARRIVGVVSDAAVDARGTMTPAVYLPYGQMGFARNWAMTYVVKGSGDVALLPALQAAVAAIDPERVVYRPSSMQRIAQEASADVRFSTLVMGVFAALALMITAVGIYGVLAVSVSQRTRELGIRAALGAEAGELRALVLAQAMRLAGLGVVCGLGLVLAGRAWIGTFVPLPELAEPRLLATVVLVLIGVALAAGYLPARRATSVQPTRALQ